VAGARIRLVLLLVVTVGSVWVSAAPAAARPPDIVVILTDDQRSDTALVMPEVRHLAAHGVRYTNAFVPTSMCCPSRTSLLTGRFSHSTGIWGNRFPRGGFRVFDDSDTLATRLQGAGYDTALFGKYLHQYDGSRIPPGWDHWFAFVRGGAYYRYDVLDQREQVHFGTGRNDYSTDVVARKAVSFIAHAEPADPIFLYVTPFAPHFPATPAPRDEGAFRGIAPFRPPSYNEPDVSDKPDWIRMRPPIASGPTDVFRERQLESLLAVDDLVGGVVGALRDAGRLRNTLIVFSSDNGVAWGEHRLAGKNTAYDAASHVPLVVRWDGEVRRGSIDRGVVAANVDVAATILRAAGAPTDQVEGVPLGRRSSLLAEGMGLATRPSYCGIRTRRRLYVGYANGEEELYTLRRDPWELRNRAGRGSSDLRRLRRMADAACGGLVPEP
jgi:N-acetylglucosamine-6-sulfatase